MKRVVALFLVVSMVLSCCLVRVQAFVSEPGRIEGIDYDKIHENETLQKEVVFKVGDYTFKGELTNGEQLTEEEVDEIITKVMRTGSDEVITSKHLITMEDMVSNAKQYDKTRYVSPTVILELALSLGGLESTKELSEMLTGEKEFSTSIEFYTEALAKTGISKLIDIALGKAVGEPLAELLGAAKNAAQVGAREYFEYVESEEKLMKAMSAALALEKFYALCNREIEKKEKEEGDNTWTLTCKQTRFMMKSFCGIGGNVQFCRLACNLERTVAASDDPADWGGRYEGSLKLKMWHNLAAFDSDFKDKIYLSSRLPFTKTAGYYEIKDLYTKNSILTKELTNAKFSVLLQPEMEEGGTLKKYFSWNGFQDETFFWSYHHIRSGMKIGPYQDGHVDLEGFGEVNEVLNHHFTGEINAGNLSVRMDMYGWDEENNWYMSAPYFYKSGNEDGQHSGSNVVRDTQIFNELRIVPELSINGIYGLGVK